MSLVRVQTVWSGVTGSPYYTNVYCIGPGSTNNGIDMANAWKAFLTSLTAVLRTGMVATIDPEILEFDETTGTVTGAGTNIAGSVTFSGIGDALPPANQALVQWQTEGIVHNRRVRGRTFIPGPVETENSASGAPGPTLTGPLLTAAQAYLTTMTGRARIWSQPFAGSPTNPPRPGSQHAITSAAVAPYFAVLRSRRS